MSSKELKDLIIVNLTGIIAVATSINTIFSDTTDDVTKLIQSIRITYWLFTAGLLVAYIYIHMDEKRQNRNLAIAHKIETQTSKEIENYEYILLLNLLITAVFILSLFYFNQLAIMPTNIMPLLLCYYELLPHLIGLVGLFSIAYYPYVLFNKYVKNRYNVNLVMLFSAGVFFNIAIQLLTHL